jgi:methionine sulfoxide reductase heme-binding subunit
MNTWFVARGAGLSALILLSLSTTLGALVSRHGDPARRYLVQYLHRACAALGLTVLALHIATILADSFANVGWSGALIPFAAGYRPTAVALGSLAAYTFIGVSLLGLARGRMAASPRAARVWRALHAMAYVGWIAAMLHGFTSGTDSSVVWVRGIYLACLAAVATSIWYRVAQLRRRDPRDRFANHPPASRPPIPAQLGAPR